MSDPMRMSDEKDPMIAEARAISEARREALWDVLDALGALSKPHELEVHGISAEDARRYVLLARAPTMRKEEDEE